MDITNKTDEELKAIIEDINDELENRKPKKTRIYLHRDKESNWELQKDLNLTDKQMENARYIGYEISVDIEIDKNGNAFATHFSGVKLPHKVQI